MESLLTGDSSSRFRCKKSGYFTKPVENITNRIFICHKQVNNDTKSNSYSLKRQKNYFCNRTKGVNVESVLLDGNPSDELIRYAEEEKMDIVIKGTLGKTELDRFLLGSVAGNLVRHSKVPVMVVREKCKS